MTVQQMELGLKLMNLETDFHKRLQLRKLLKIMEVQPKREKNVYSLPKVAFGA